MTSDPFFVLGKLTICRCILMPFAINIGSYMMSFVFLSSVHTGTFYAVG